MIQKMRKKLGCKKGFTLIELIVVIAILGILALVAIPKLTGFQQNAKAKADISNARMIANQAAVLVANGDITVPATDPATITTEKKLTDAMETGALPKPQLKGTAFTVKLDKDGKITVFNGAEELYPTPAATYK